MSAAIPLVTEPPAISPATALKVMTRISERWKIERQQLASLIGIRPRTLRAWSEHAPIAIERDTLERISHLISIFDGLHVVFDDDFADRWMHEPNTAFDGRTPLSLLLTGSFTNLIAVRQYVEYGRSL